MRKTLCTLSILATFASCTRDTPFINNPQQMIVEAKRFYAQQMNNPKAQNFVQSLKLQPSWENAIIDSLGTIRIPMTSKFIMVNKFEIKIWQTRNGLKGKYQQFIPRRDGYANLPFSFQGNRLFRLIRRKKEATLKIKNNSISTKANIVNYLSEPQSYSDENSADISTNDYNKYADYLLSTSSHNGYAAIAVSLMPCPAGLLFDPQNCDCNLSEDISSYAYPKFYLVVYQDNFFEYLPYADSLEDVIIITTPNDPSEPGGGNTGPIDSGGGGGISIGSGDGNNGTTASNIAYEKMTDDEILEDINHSNFSDPTLQKPRPKFSDLIAHTLPATYTPAQIGAAIGGEVATALGNDGNTCATRVSYALNYSGNPIPSRTYTADGADGKYYIVRAQTLLSYLKSAYEMNGPTIHLTSQNNSLTSQSIKTAINGKQGIYVIIPIDPSNGTGFGASGHVDILSSDGSFASGHAYYACIGGVKEVYLFQLSN